jgi:hypothetical protein
VTNPPVVLPYVFTDAEPNQAPQPILAPQVNANFAALQAAFTGYSSTLRLPISGNTTLLASQATNGGFIFEGTLTANANIIFPAGFIGFAAIENATSGGFSINVGMLSGTFVGILNASWVAIWSDGTNFNSLVSSGEEGSTTGSGAFVLQNNPTIVSPTFTGTAGGSDVIPNALLQHSTVTINGNVVSLGGSVVIPTPSQIVAVVAKSANYAVQTIDIATLFTTDGSTSAINFTLPGIELGLYYGFVLTAGTSIQITAASGATITLPSNRFPEAANVSTMSLSGVTVEAGGTGYGNDQTFTATLVGGTVYAGATGTASVTSNSSGVVVTVNSVSSGIYTAQPSQPNAATGGTGTGLMLNMTFNPGYIISTVPYSFVIVTAISATNWFATTIEGSWMSNTNGYYGLGYYSDGYYGVGGV